MENANSKATNLAYQKQLFNTLNSIVSFRTNLIKHTALLALEGKEKEFPSVYSQIKFIRKSISKNEDLILKKISEILIGLEEPIKELEKNLELKNSFLSVISEETFVLEESIDQ